MSEDGGLPVGGGSSVGVGGRSNFGRRGGHGVFARLGLVRQHNDLSTFVQKRHRLAVAVTIELKYICTYCSM